MSRKLIRTIAVSALAASLMATPVLADWTEDIQNQNCDSSDRQAFGKSLRGNIESKVRRAEASIQAPSPVGDLSCLNDLMNAPLDIFSGMGSLLGSLSAGLGNISPSSLGLDTNLSGAICGAAAKKWSTLTSSLATSASSLSDFAQTASSAADRITSGVTASIPGFSGDSSSADSSGISGSISGYNPTATVNPTTEVSSATSAIPIYPSYKDTQYNDAAMNTAYSDYENNVAKELGDYIGCMVAKNMSGANVSGSGYYNGTITTHPNSSDCTFNPGTAPTYTFSK